MFVEVPPSIFKYPFQIKAPQLWAPSGAHSGSPESSLWSPQDSQMCPLHDSTVNMTQLNTHAAAVSRAPVASPGWGSMTDHELKRWDSEQLKTVLLFPAQSSERLKPFSQELNFESPQWGSDGICVDVKSLQGRGDLGGFQMWRDAEDTMRLMPCRPGNLLYTPGCSQLPPQFGGDWR